MKVRITYIYNDGVLTEEVEKIEPDTTSTLFMPGANLYEDKEGLFYVPEDFLLSEEKI